MYPGAYGMMAAPRPVAAAPQQQPAPAAPQKPANELVRALTKIGRNEQLSALKLSRTEACFGVCKCRSCS